MRISRIFAFPISAILLFGCKSKPHSIEGMQPNGDIIAIAEMPRIAKTKSIQGTSGAMPATQDSTFVDLKNYSRDFVYDMKYATTDNFLKAQVYDCAECFLRLKTVEALIAANKDFGKLGYKIKIFDCYRPLDIQKRMWKIVSDPNYVANPKTGSIHNRGGAVDITLVDASGKEIEMGTAFDHFGPEAGVTYANLSEEVLKNRQLLQEIMRNHGFSVLKSEWWHFNYENAAKQKISNFKWDCN